MNESLPAPAVPQTVVLEEFDHELTLPTDDSPLFTVLLPLLALLVVYLGVLINAASEDPRLPLLDRLDLGGCEEGVHRLPEADRQANQRHESHVQGAGLDLLEVLPVDVASFRRLL